MPRAVSEETAGGESGDLEEKWDGWRDRFDALEGRKGFVDMKREEGFFVFVIVVVSSSG